MKVAINRKRMGTAKDFTQLFLKYRNDKGSRIAQYFFNEQLSFQPLSRDLFGIVGDNVNQPLTKGQVISDGPELPKTWDSVERLPRWIDIYNESAAKITEMKTKSNGRFLINSD